MERDPNDLSDADREQVLQLLDRMKKLMDRNWREIEPQFRLLQEEMNRLLAPR